jgi:hypothetical protein
MKKLTCAFLVISLFLSNCGMYNRRVRNSYADKKLAYATDMDNYQKASASTFKNYMKLTTSRVCDFDLYRFCSYSYHYQSQYTSTDIDIYSSLIKPKQFCTTLGNVMNDYLKKNADGTYVIRSYSLLDDETLLTKDLTCEIVISADRLDPGTYDGNSIHVTIIDESGILLFDSKAAGAQAQLKINGINNNVLYASVSGSCSINGNRYTIHDGDFWVKM